MVVSDCWYSQWLKSYDSSNIKIIVKILKMGVPRRNDTVKRKTEYVQAIQG